LAWIKFDKDLVDDPRILTAAEALAERYTVSIESAKGEGFAIGSDLDSRDSVTLMRNAVTGALVTLWVYADTHIRDGDVLPISMDSIDRMVGINGFCELLGPDWVHETNYGVFTVLPGYCAKNGLQSKEKRRAENANRQRRYRQTHNAVSNSSSNAVTNGRVTALDQDLDQDQKKKKLSAVALPEWLPAEAWKDWLEVRTKAKAPNTNRALTLALGELTALRDAGNDPRAVLERATVKGWKSLYPVKSDQPQAVKYDA
jgi:hypothetical protein